MSGIRNSSELGSKWSLGSHTLISIANVIPQEEQNLEVVSSGNSESNEQSVSSRITHSEDNESAARGRLEEDPYVAEATRITRLGSANLIAGMSHESLTDGNPPEKQVPDRIFRFTLSRRVEQSQLLRLGEVKVSIWGLCAGPKSNELLFADSRNGAVRALDMSTSKIASRDTFRCPETESVRSVAYCFETDTLFVVSWNYAARNLNVRACGLTDNEWIECHSLRLPGIGPFKDVLLRVLSRGTICCSQLESDTVHSCLVKEDRSLQQLHRFILSAKHIGFDVHLTTDETLLAAALWDGSVALFSLIGEQCVERSRLKLADLCYLPLFRGETLLVRHRVNADRAEVAAISISGGRLERERVLFPNDQRLVDTLGSWCLLESEATLVLWRREAKELHFYNSNE